MKMYLVHLDAFPMQDRVKACQKLSQFAWDVYEQVDPELGLVAAKVAWDSADDFESSPCFPVGCRCEKI